MGEARVRAVVEEAVKTYTDTSGAIVLRNTFIWSAGQRR
jgi:hypothetical protein